MILMGYTESNGDHHRLIQVVVGSWQCGGSLPRENDTPSGSASVTARCGIPDIQRGGLTVVTTPESAVREGTVGAGL